MIKFIIEYTIANQRNAYILIVNQLKINTSNYHTKASIVDDLHMFQSNILSCIYTLINIFVYIPQMIKDISINN